MRVTGLNHASFTVGDLDQTIAFFVDGLGYRLISRGPRDPGIIQRITAVEGADLEIAFVEGPGHRIELIRYKAPADRQVVIPRIPDTGATHIGLDVDDIEQAVAIAGRHGFRLVGEIVAIDGGPNKGRRVAYTRNGDGILVEFLQSPHV